MNIHSAAGDVMRRREEILRLVRTAPLRSQDELIARLAGSGFKVTQPTLSRDLRELGLVKTPAGYISPEELAPVAILSAPREHRFEALVRESVVSAEAAGNMVVIRTPVAAAQPVASAIDLAAIADLLGTIGGDDTIFLAFRTPTAAAQFARRIHDLAGLSPAARRTRA